MASNTLSISIDPDSLKIVKAAQLKVTLAKPVGTGEKPNVTWIVFDPFQGNTIEWDENYGIYASATPLNVGGAVISRMSETSFPATSGAYYSFDSSSTFKGPFTTPDAPQPGSYRVNNDMPNTQYPFLTFGLQQKASINGSGIDPLPLNAAVVPASYNATFTPFNIVYVWLQAEFLSGTVITEVSGKAAIVTFGGGVTRQALVYDPIQGRFVPSSSPQKMSAAPERAMLAALPGESGESAAVQQYTPSGLY